jgi:uncharacterized RDD family membrane protein YckC
VQYAGLGARFAASIIDVVIVAIAMGVVGALLGGNGADGFNVEGMAALVLFLIPPVYWSVMEATWGATVGKNLMGIKVVKVDGTSPIGWGPAVIRNLIRFAPVYAVATTIGVFAILRSPNQQRVFDRFAGTVVVRRAPAPAVAQS